MPDEPITPTPSTATASPQGAQSEPQPTTQTGNLADRIASLAFPEGKPLPYTPKQATALEKKQADVANAQAQTPAAATATANVDDAPPAELSEKGKESWKKWKAAEREKYAELEKKWQATNTELETFKKTPPKPAEPVVPLDYEEIKKRESELSEKLKLLDIEQHPQFQKHFGERFNAVFAAAKQIGGPEQGEKIAALLKLPDSDYKTAQLDAITESLSPSKKSMMGALLMKYEEVSGERNSELSKAKENYAAYTSRVQEAQKRQQEQAKAQAERAFEEQLQAAQKDLPVFQKRDGDEAWNKQVDSAIQTARNIYTGNMPLPDLARASQWSAAGPLLAQDAHAKGKEIETLKAEITRLKGALPKPGGGTDPKEPEIPANLSLADRIVLQAQRAGVVR